MDLERQGLQTYLRASAWLLLLAGLLPFDFSGREPVWPWQGLLDAGPVDGVSLLLPLVGAALAFWLGRRGWSKLALAASWLGALGLAWVIGWWGELVPYPLAVYSHLADGLPALFGRSFWLLVLGAVLLAAGLRLGARGHLEPLAGRPPLADPLWPARWLTAAGIGSTVLFYLLPYRGTVPLWDLAGGIVALLPHLDSVEGLALLSGHVLSIGPLGIALAGGLRLVRRAPGHGGLLASLAVGFLPGLCLLVGLRNLPQMPAYTLIHLRSAAVLLVLTVGAALCLAALLRAAWYEVPWLFGRLTATDDMLAAALSSPDPDGSLRRSLAALHPLPRRYVERRLALWRAAAAEVPGAAGADLSAVIRFLDRRWTEEQADAVALAGSPVAVPAGRLRAAGPSWPAWLRGPWLSLAPLAVLGLLVAGSLSLAERPDTGQRWVVGPDQADLALVFTDQLPEVVLDLDLPAGDFRDRAAYKDLARTLGRLAPRLPGLGPALERLLDLGRHGRGRLHRLRRARDRLNRLLRAHHVPYYVRSRVRAGPRPADDLFYLLTYRIRACRRYRPRRGGRTFAVLQLVRADALAVVETYMGMTEEEETFVTVFLERLGYFMRERIGQLIERPDRLGRVARRALAELGGRPADLAAGTDRPLGAALLEGLTRHELHHRWLGLEPSPPTALWAFLIGYPEETARGVTAEVGAYLGELRYRPAYARLRLALMLDALEQRAGRKGIHGRARAFVVQRLLLPDAGAPGPASAAVLARASEALDRLDDPALVARLDSLHADLFGVPVPDFEAVAEPPPGRP